MRSIVPIIGPHQKVANIYAFTSFEHLTEWQQVVCRRCHCAMCPSGVATHLTNKQHGQNRKIARRIADDISQWLSIVNYPSMFELLAWVETPITQLPLFDDGLHCQIDAMRCRYIARDIKALEGHWRTSHG